VRAIHTSDNEAVKHRGGLPHMNDRLFRDEPITIAFLGGSITEGAGATDANATSWRAIIESYLKERFSEEKVTCLNAGVGGTTSTFGAHRLQKHVLSQGNIDLLFVEFSVNDGTDREESIRGMEGIVRQCRQLSPRTDICFLYTAADKNLTEHMPFNIAVHEEVASHYAIPSISFAASVYARMKTGQVRWEELASDRVHPNDEGHALYAGFLQAYLEIALRANEAVSSRQESAVTLPTPLAPDNYEYAGMWEVAQADRVVEFEWRTLTTEPLMNWRFETAHLYTDSLEASLSFIADGQSAGLLLLCGPPTGLFEYSIDDRPFIEVNLFDDWCLKAFRPIIAMFPIEAERQSRRITIRLTDTKDERSTGTSLRILHLFSN
jgi:acyl-CoA thioesterase-1